MNNSGNALNTLQKEYQFREITTNAPMQSSQLMKLFEDELKDIYWITKALTNAIPKMIKNATSRDLVEALINHLTETEHQIIRVERVFDFLDKKPIAKKCLAIEGQIKEVELMMASCDPGSMCDAGIISTGKKLDHYEIASYETLIQFAETLKGLEDVVEMFEVSLDELKASVEIFSGVSVSAIQVEENTEEGDEESKFGFDHSYHLQFS